jgi:hypothetical protein
MSEALEIYRDPQRDVAIVDLAPGLKLTVPMSFFSKYGTLQMNLEEVSPVLEELYSLITLIPAQGNPGITLKEAMKFDGR